MQPGTLELHGATEEAQITIRQLCSLMDDLARQTASLAREVNSQNLSANKIRENAVLAVCQTQKVTSDMACLTALAEPALDSAHQITEMSDNARQQIDLLSRGLNGLQEEPSTDWFQA